MLYTLTFTGPVQGHVPYTNQLRNSNCKFGAGSTKTHSLSSRVKGSDWVENMKKWKHKNIKRLRAIESWVFFFSNHQHAPVLVPERSLVEKALDFGRMWWGENARAHNDLVEKDRPCMSCDSSSRRQQRVRVCEPAKFRAQLEMFQERPLKHGYHKLKDMAQLKHGNTQRAE